MLDRRVEAKKFWDDMYEHETQPRPFGDNITYQLGADFIGELPVEDWGCGLGWYQQFAKGPYRGVDGSKSMFCDEEVDLRTYRSDTPAIFMRHVLEHNPFEWTLILDNAVASFTKKMVLVIFTPMETFTILLKDGDPPDVSFSWDDLTSHFTDQVTWTHEHLLTHTVYGGEHLFYLEKQ